MFEWVLNMIRLQQMEPLGKEIFIREHQYRVTVNFGKYSTKIIIL